MVSYIWKKHNKAYIPVYITNNIKITITNNKEAL